MFKVESFKRFASDCQNNLAPVLKPVLEGLPYSPLDISKEIDKIAYRYTGEESLICDTVEDRKRKIIKVEDTIEFFHAKEDQIKELTEEKFRETGAETTINSEDVLVGIFAHMILRSIVSRDPGFVFEGA